MRRNEVLANALVRERQREAHARRFEKQALAAREGSPRSFPIVSQLLARWRGIPQPLPEQVFDGQRSTLRLNLRNE